MSATTLRIDTSQKRRFDRLQAALRLKMGRRVTQAEVLDRLLAQGEVNPDSLAAKPWRPPTKEQIERVLAMPADYGVEIGDVDEGLYGRRRRRKR